MNPSYFFDTLPLQKGKWSVDSFTQFKNACSEIEALLQSTGSVDLMGDHTPIDSIAIEGKTVVVRDTNGGILTIPVLGTLQQALLRALDPIIVNQIFLAKNTTHACVLGEEYVIVLGDGLPYAEVLFPKDATHLTTLGEMPAWLFAFNGKLSKIEASIAPTIVEKIEGRLKKEQPQFILRDDSNGQWYAGFELESSTNATVLKMASTPQKAYTWARLRDLLAHAMALEGLFGFNWRIYPTAPGWDCAGKGTADVNMTIFKPIPPTPFSVHQYDPRHGGVEEVISAEKFRTMADIRQHHETVGIVPYGALACNVLFHLDADTPGVDTFVALCDSSHVAPIKETLEQLGIATRNNPAIRLVQKRTAPDHVPTVWSLALSQETAWPLLQRAAAWPGVAIASHPWKDMWP